MPHGIATELVHVDQPVTAERPGYYRPARDGEPVVGYAGHCANFGEPLTVNDNR